MFESIVSKFVKAMRNAVRVIGAATRPTPWLVPAAIFAVLLVL